MDIWGSCWGFTRKAALAVASAGVLGYKVVRNCDFEKGVSDWAETDIGKRSVNYMNKNETISNTMYAANKFIEKVDKKVPNFTETCENIVEISLVPASIFVAAGEITRNSVKEGSFKDGTVKAIKENPFANNVANGAVNTVIKYGDTQIGQSLLKWGGDKFVPKDYKKELDKVLLLAKTPEGQKALTIASDCVFDYLKGNQLGLHNGVRDASVFLASEDGKKVVKEIGQSVEGDIPRLASKVVQLESVQNLAKEKWNNLSPGQKEEIKVALNKLGIDIQNLNPEKLTEENITKIYNKVFPIVKDSFCKFVGSESNFEDITKLDSKDVDLVKFAYVATDKAKGKQTVHDSYEVLEHIDEKSNKNGFEVFVQRSSKEGRIIISYKDTDDVADLSSDIQLAGNKKPEQLDKALEIYKKYKDDDIYRNDEIIITGHSLGGSLTELICSSPEAREHGKTKGFVFNSYGVKDNLQSCGNDYKDNGNVIGVVCKSDFFVAKAANHVGKTYSVDSEIYADIPSVVIKEATEEYMNTAIQNWSIEKANAQLAKIVKDKAKDYKEVHQLRALDKLKINDKEIVRI